VSYQCKSTEDFNNNHQHNFNQKKFLTVSKSYLVIQHLAKIKSSLAYNPSINYKNITWNDVSITYHRLQLISYVVAWNESSQTEKDHGSLTSWNRINIQHYHLQQTRVLKISHRNNKNDNIAGGKLRTLCFPKCRILKVQAVFPGTQLKTSNPLSLSLDHFPHPTQQNYFITHHTYKHIHAIKTAHISLVVSVHIILSHVLDSILKKSNRLVPSRIWNNTQKFT